MLGCGLINARLSVVSGLLVLYHWWELPQVVLSPHKFCHNKCVCHDKNMFVVVVTTKHVFCHDKSMLVATKHMFVMTNICRDKSFVATKTLLQQT